MICPLYTPSNFRALSELIAHIKILRGSMRKEYKAAIELYDKSLMYIITNTGFDNFPRGSLMEDSRIGTYHVDFTKE